LIAHKYACAFDSGVLGEIGQPQHVLGIAGELPLHLSVEHRRSKVFPRAQLSPKMLQMPCVDQRDWIPVSL